MRTASKIWVAVGLVAICLAGVALRNYFRMRHAKASNEAINGLRITPAVMEAWGMKTNTVATTNNTK